MGPFLRLILSIGIVFLVNAPAHATYKGERLAPDGFLLSRSSDMIQSADGRFRLVMQTDCNLVVYKGRHALWASGTNGKGDNCWAVMQGDGNFVVYDGSHKPLWASGTNGRNGSFIIAQNDGNVVVYQGSRPFWASNTRVPEPASTPVSGHPDILQPGQALDGSKNDYLQVNNKPSIILKMQDDCNLVLYVLEKPYFASNTNGLGNDCKAIMQFDGNLVVYKGDGQVAWASGTNGKNGAYLSLQQDGNARIFFSNTHQVVWSAHSDPHPPVPTPCSLNCGTPPPIGGPPPIPWPNPPPPPPPPPYPATPQTIGNGALGGACVSGFVWREAIAGDRVCVAPVTRTEAWSDNNSRPRETCPLGLVWREATPSDHVCVPPETRKKTWDDNARGGERVAK